MMIKVMAIIASMSYFLVIATQISSMETARFYIYEWPHLIDRYANFSDRPHHGHGVEFPAWRENLGIGRALDVNNHEYKTSQFALFKIMYERALVDPRRTMDPNDATSFFIPYDFGMDATFFESNGRMRRTQCPLAVDALQHLRNSPYFWRHGGHDHTLIVAVNQNMNYFFSAPRCTSFLHMCWNCTKLAIDEYMFIAQDRKFELKNRGINWHAIPFPSDYHYDTTVNTLPPWERPSEQENRSVLVSFLGNPRKFSPISTSIREALVIQCKQHDEYCSQGIYQHDGSADNSPNRDSRNAVFCLQPPGDMPTRKSLFDSILSGCIPVLFHPLTARYMYEWHLGQSGWEEVGIHFDKDAENNALIEQKLDVVAALYELYSKNRTLVDYKRQRIRELAHQLQYSKLYKDTATNSTRVCFKRSTLDGNLSVIVPDAYNMAMDKVLQIHSGELSHNRTSEYLTCEALRTRGGARAQTSDHCVPTGSSDDPYSPAALRSPLFSRGHSDMAS